MVCRGIKGEGGEERKLGSGTKGFTDVIFFYPHNSHEVSIISPLNDRVMECDSGGGT